MADLAGKVAWVTGGGSGIGQAAAVALAGAGVSVVVSGRRLPMLAETIGKIEQVGGKGSAELLDVSGPGGAEHVVDTIRQRFGRLDILLNNAGVNIGDRRWNQYERDQWDQLVKTNLNGAMYCIGAVLPIMRERKDGLIINISSWAGRYQSYVAGAIYSASKHALLALNASVNMEECVNGIRACAICPAEVATPILDRRPVPVDAATRAKMLQPEDLAETVLYVARMPARVCVNEILISPTWNRSYIGGADMHPPVPE